MGLTSTIGVFLLRQLARMSPSFLKRRHRAVVGAMDQVLMEYSRRLNLTCKDKHDYGQLAVRINQYQCGPAARYIEAKLLGMGHKGFTFKNICGCHYVILDQLTGRIYDLETYDGEDINTAENIAIFQRELAYCEALSRREVKSIDAQFAARWAVYRAAYG